MFNVSLASERKQRSLSKEAIGDNLAAEMAPFSFTVDNGVEFREVPFVFVPNLIARVTDKLNQHYQYVYNLTSYLILLMKQISSWFDMARQHYSQ